MCLLVYEREGVVVEIDRETERQEDRTEKEENSASDCVQLKILK